MSSKNIPEWQFDLIRDRVRNAEDNFCRKFDGRGHNSVRYTLPERFTARYLVKEGIAPMRSEEDIRKRLTNPCRGSFEYGCIFDIEELPAYKHGKKLCDYVKSALKDVHDGYTDTVYKCKMYPDKIEAAIAAYEKAITVHEKKIAELEAVTL